MELRDVKTIEKKAVEEEKVLVVDSLATAMEQNQEETVNKYQVRLDSLHTELKNKETEIARITLKPSREEQQYVRMNLPNAVVPALREQLVIKTGNTAQKLNDDLWKWKIYIAAPNSILNKIKCVEYTLHPTFPNPVHLVCTRGNGSKAFPLEARGWGTFRVKVLIYFKDKSTRELYHNLNF